MTATMDAVKNLLEIPCAQHQTSIPTCPECGSPVAVWAEIQQLREEARLLRVRSEYIERDHQQLCRGLEPLCPCDYNPATTDGPQQECPIHGDGVTFVEYVQSLEREVVERRASVTTGGPGVPFTEGWERGPSSRPSTAPPEDEEVQLPSTVHPHGNPYNCPCPDEAPARAVDYVEEPPPR